MKRRNHRLGNRFSMGNYISIKAEYVCMNGLFFFLWAHFHAIQQLQYPRLLLRLSASKLQRWSRQEPRKQTMEKTQNVFA